MVHWHGRGQRWGVEGAVCLGPRMGQAGGFLWHLSDKGKKTQGNQAQHMGLSGILI